MTIQTLSKSIFDVPEYFDSKLAYLDAAVFMLSDISAFKDFLRAPRPQYSKWGASELKNQLDALKALETDPLASLFINEYVLEKLQEVRGVFAKNEGYVFLPYTSFVLSEAPANELIKKLSSPNNRNNGYVITSDGFYTHPSIEQTVKDKFLKSGGCSAIKIPLTEEHFSDEILNYIQDFVSVSDDPFIYKIPFNMSKTTIPVEFLLPTVREDEVFEILNRVYPTLKEELQIDNLFQGLINNVTEKLEEFEQGASESDIRTQIGVYVHEYKSKLLQIISADAPTIRFLSYEHEQKIMDEIVAEAKTNTMLALKLLSFNSHLSPEYFNALFKKFWNKAYSGSRIESDTYIKFMRHEFIGS